MEVLVGALVLQLRQPPVGLRPASGAQLGLPELHQGDRDRLGLAAGTHAFSDWKKQESTDGERYKVIVEDLQDVARANLIFGLHVHVGIKDRDVAMALANQVRYFLPHILALSTSSPFWLGRNTGLKSVRSEIFKRFPRTGIPG